jgi:hypothetical protein
MKTREPNAVLAYWLRSAEPARNFFASTIAGFAARFDGPVFEPHVTVYAGKKRDENPEEILHATLAGCGPLRLLVCDIQHSDQFTKTVFVQFEPSTSLLQLSRRLLESSTAHEEYQLNPHLSLIYKKMTRNQRVEVASSIRLPFTEVVFDLAKAVICPTPIRSREDVESWRVVATQPLTK